MRAGEFAGEVSFSTRWRFEGMRTSGFRSVRLGGLEPPARTDETSNPLALMRSKSLPHYVIFSNEQKEVDGPFPLPSPNARPPAAPPSEAPNLRRCLTSEGP